MSEVLHIFGRPSSGKTTLAMQIAKHLRADGHKVCILDGDNVRAWLTPDCDFSPDGRRRNVERVLRVGDLLAKSGTVAICVLVTPYKDMRVRTPQRKIIYCSTPLSVCEHRDTKLLYATNAVGIRDFEEPNRSDVDAYIDCCGISSPTSSAHIALERLGYALDYRI